VLTHWLSEGACGYRLDVADELPDDVLQSMRRAVKEKDEDAVLIGEVWEDATTKYSLGGKRRYALGGALDSVTNYPFRNAVVDFLCNKIDSESLKGFFISQAANYPPPMYYALMNMLSSHDIERIRTALSVQIDPHTLNREQQALFFVNVAQNEKGAARHRLAMAIQMSMPGVPCVYYGDETGMQGLLDPFNRAPFSKGRIDLTEDYARFGNIRNGADALSLGHAAFFAPDPDCIGILRYIIGGKDAMGNPAQDGVFLTAVNRSGEEKRLVFDMMGLNPLLSPRDKNILKQRMQSQVKSLLSGESYAAEDGMLELALPPFGMALLKLD
jgi:glycosidase